MRGFSIILILKGIMMFCSQKAHAFLLTKNINLNKKETKSKVENTTNSFTETCALAHLKLKVKL